MDSDDNQQTLDFQSHKPLRSILKSSNTRPTGSRSSPSGSRIRIHESTHANSPLHDVSQLVVPSQGPTPAFCVPSMTSREQLEAFTFQIAAQLRSQRLADEEEEANRPPPLPRPTGKPDEFPEFSVILMGKWVAGPDLGPVLAPKLAMSRGLITVNPMLASPFSGQRRFDWDVRLDFEAATYKTSEREIPITLRNARLQPATAPKLPRLCIVSNSFTWSMTVDARDVSAGVTVYDALYHISGILQMTLAERDLQNANPSHRSAVTETARARNSCSMGLPGVRVFDWLLGAVKFGGLVHNPDYVTTNVSRRDDAFFVLSFES